MATETRSFVDIFFHYQDAIAWIDGHLHDYRELQSDWFTKELEIKLMDSGAYRAGIVFEKRQGELF